MKKEADSTGSPVGVVRLDVDRAYAGVGELLQRYINDSDQKACIAAVTSGEEKLLDFVCYLPEGFDSLQDTQVPNVETTHDPKRMMTAIFAGGSEVWPALGL